VTKRGALTLALVLVSVACNAAGVHFEVSLGCWMSVILWLAAQQVTPGFFTAWLFCACFSVGHFSFVADAAWAYWAFPKSVGVLVIALASPLLEPQWMLYAWARKSFPSARAGAVGFGLALYYACECFWPKLLGDTWAYGLYPDEVVRQSAALFGAHGLTLAMVLHGELFLSCVLPLSAGWGSSSSTYRDLRNRWPILLAFVALHLSLQFIGRFQLAEKQKTTSFHVLGVQGSLEPYAVLIERGGTGGLLENVVDRYEGLTSQALRDGPVDLVVWPETVYPTTLGALKSEAQRAFDDRIFALSKQLKAPLVLGTYELGQGTEYNTAALVFDGEVLERHRKVRLFPVSEAIPMGKTLQRLGLWNGPIGWGRGTGPAVWEIPGAHIWAQPFICYESLEPRFSNSPQAAMLINLTNDDWFQSEVQAKLHLWVSAFRSIEAHRPQIRVTNGGLTAAIDAYGSLTGIVPKGAWRAQRFELKLPVSGAVPFARFVSNWGGFSSLAVVLLGLSRAGLVWVKRWRL
jgi:apolipoprotein N-acyltransferase